MDSHHGRPRRHSLWSMAVAILSTHRTSLAFRPGSDRFVCLVKPGIGSLGLVVEPPSRRDVFPTRFYSAFIFRDRISPLPQPRIEAPGGNDSRRGSADRSAILRRNQFPIVAGSLIRAQRIPTGSVGPKPAQITLVDHSDLWSRRGMALHDADHPASGTDDDHSVESQGIRSHQSISLN